MTISYAMWTSADRAIECAVVDECVQKASRLDICAAPDAAGQASETLYNTTRSGWYAHLVGEETVAGNPSECPPGQSRKPSNAAKQLPKLRRRSMTLPLEVPECFEASGSITRGRAHSCTASCDLDVSQTVFRRWEYGPSAPESIIEGPVAGLRDAFKEAGLASYDSLAETWCCDNGAAFITELVEWEDDLCSTLGLGPHLHMRLHKALLSHLDSDDDTDDGDSQGYDIADERVAQTISYACEERTLMPGSSMEGPVPGLRDAFEEAGLASCVQFAEAWCRDNGAAFPHEVVECSDEICSMLGLEPQVSARLRSALLAHAHVGCDVVNYDGYELPRLERAATKHFPGLPHRSVTLPLVSPKSLEGSRPFAKGRAATCNDALACSSSPKAFCGAEYNLAKGRGFRDAFRVPGFAC